MKKSLFGEPGVSRAVEQRVAAPADSDHEIDIERNSTAGFVVIFELAFPQLEHVADHGDAASANVSLLHQREGARKRIRIRVVTVVVNRRAAPRHNHASMVRRLGLRYAPRDPVPGDADRARGRNRGQQILEIVPAGQSEIEGAALESEMRPEEAALDDVGGPEIGGLIDPIRHLPPLESSAHVHEVLVVDVEDHGAVGREIFQKLALGLRDFFERAEKFDVHRPDVGVDADVGTGEAGQRGDLALVIHPHLANHDLGIVGSVVETQRRADEVVEVAP